MKIALIAPGQIEIPPNGWGALETVVWNQYSQLKNSGYDVIIVNDSDANQTYKKIEEYDPDIVHLHYGKHYEILPYINRKKIITNHDGSFLYSQKFHEDIIRNFMYDCNFFVLTSWEKQFLLNIGFSEKSIRIVPNGVDVNKFRITNSPKYKNSSICLGKIDERKNQAYLQSLNNDIYFVGQNHDPNFNPLDSYYLGSWTRDVIYNNLTEYSNLILLSMSELQPLVCLEALSAGLGLVITEESSQNLDLSLPFITVIKKEQLKDINYIKNKINQNKNYCNSINRDIITDYAKQFDWKYIINNKYLQYISNIL